MWIKKTKFMRVKAQIFIAFLVIVGQANVVSAQQQSCDILQNIEQKYNDICQAFLRSCLEQTNQAACHVLDNTVALSADAQISFWMSMEHFVAESCVQGRVACESVAAYTLRLQ